MTRTRAVCMAAAVVVVGASMALATSLPVRLEHQGAPAYWRMLPDVDQAAGAGDRASGYQSVSWGDPATGVFLVVGYINVNDPELRAVHQAMARALGDLGVEVSGFISERFISERSISESKQQEQAQPLSRFAVRRGELAGQARLLTWSAEPGVVTARLAVCFHTPREPVLAARVCERVLQTYEHIPSQDAQQDPEESKR